MKALVLDFDGVISDSAREAFVVSRRAYLDLRPDSPLVDADENRTFASFLAMMPLGNRAEDYGTVLAALETGRELPDQPAYDAFRRRQDPAWLEVYHRRFYEVRAALAAEDPERWLGLMRPYRPFLRILERRAGEIPFAIATSKDRCSVNALLRAYGIESLFPGDLILDKEAGERKSAHIRLLAARLDLPYARLAFIDDKVNHLDAVAGLGVRCALAAWGYNGPREHALARERGYLVCSLEDVEATLFGGT